MNWIGAISVSVFYAIVFAAGIWAGWVQKKKMKKCDNTQADVMFLAERDLGLFVGILTLTATWVGGSYINGTVEAIFTKGIVWCLPPFGYSLSLILGGMFFAKPMREKGYVTLLDPFQEKYGRRIGGLFVIPALFADIVWVGTVLYVLGSTLSVILDVNVTAAVVVSAAIVMLYVLFGGLYSVAYTDVIQLFCILLGLIVAVPFAWNNPAVGSLSPKDTDWIGEVKSADVGVYIESICLIVLGGIPFQSYFQRVLAARTPRDASILSYAAGGVCLLMALPCVLLGIVAKGTDWHMTGYLGNFTTPDEIKSVLPLTLEHLTPQWVSVLGLGAVSAAIMSSADSAVLSASTLLAQNVFKNLLYPRASGKSVLIVTWLSILVVTSVSIIMALSVKSILGMAYLCSDLVYVILFPQLLLVVYCPDICNSYGALAAYIIGAILRVIGGEPLIGLPAVFEYPLFQDGEQKFPFRTLAMVVSIFVHLIVSKTAAWLFTKQYLPRRCDLLGVFPEVDEVPLENIDVVTVKSDTQ